MDSAIEALEYIKSHYTEFENYTEVIYTAKSGMEIGAYYNGKTRELFIKPDGRTQGHFEITGDEIDLLVEAFEKVKNAFDE